MSGTNEGGERKETAGVRQHLASLAVLGVLFVVPGAAIAADPVLLVEDTTDAPSVEAARSRVQLLTGVVIPPERTRGVDDLVAATGYAALTAGGASVFTCKGPALDAGGFDARLSEVVRLVDELDLDRASAAVASLQADLPCSVAAIPARQLHDVFFFTGLMAAYRGERDEAIDQFSRAAALKPDVTWNESYDPSAQQLFLLGKERAITAEMVLFSALPPTDARRVWLDGRATSEAAMEAQVRPGTHLVHVETTTGSLRAIGVRLEPGVSALWSDPRAAAQAVMDGASEGPAARAAEALLALGLAEWSADTFYVSSRRGVLRYSADVGFEKPRRPLAPVGDRVTFGLGAAVLVRDAPYRKPFVYAAPGLDVSVAVLRGLEVSLFGRAGLASFSESTLSVLPAWGLGLQWAFAGVAVRPYVGAQAAFTAQHETAASGLRVVRVTAGGLARLGVRLAPGSSAFRLGIGVSFGWVGGIHASAGVTVGFGLRPSKARGS